MKRYRRIAMAWMLVLVMLVTASCQAVGNVDMNRILTRGLDLASYEGSLSLSLDLDLDESAANLGGADRLIVLKAIDGLKLVVDEIKQRDRQTSSVRGTLHTTRGTIPFRLSTDDGAVTVLADGARQPFVFQSPGLADGQESTSIVPQLEAFAQSYSREFQIELTSRLIRYLVPHLPNPERLTVVRDEQPIRGETVSAYRIHVELTAAELRSLLQTLIQNVLDDEKGLQSIIRDFIDLAAEQPGAPEVLSEHKELSALFAANLLHGWLLQTASDLQQGGSFLGPASALSLTLTTDEQGFTRKSEGTITITPMMKTMSAVKAIRIAWNDEYGKLNEPVTVTPVSSGAEPVRLDARTKAFRILDNLSPDSVVYGWLKDDLRITRKQIKLPTGEGDKPTREGILNPFIKGQGVTMVPARFVSERLDADIYWDGDTRQVRIEDPQTGKIIVLTVDSRQAVVDGMPIELEEAAEIVQGATFVPVRFIAEQLGATVEWDGTTRTVSIVRE